ncbi:S24 family peptidase [Alteriqipengyuania lutimaris]|uniref:LexA family transcriptional regulator n=1 Tax=Alteriqipengyuania lutimaris TaxID=1538146 RepID=A0A395LHE8_9SPHN|nr:LexA family transcriptional regulator [Alteriqipengyuania lutimaris]MBB3035499.1 phage repressor protein C with HTH and peptisase S24 domain [Alteriqipengyuania lutimaris]RDS76061.1 LexA family transcriptional regulator [Alteriqipengyuania lutimaris]
MNERPTSVSADASDPARERLLQLAKGRGASLAGLSALIGRNSSYLQQFIRKGSPRKLEEQDRRTLAEFFGVDESELGGAFEGSGEKSYTLRGAAANDEDFHAIPRLSLAAAAGPGQFAGGEAPFDNFGFSGRWLRENGFDPKMLSALTVEGDSMEPLLRHGDEILVDRGSRFERDGVHVVRLGDTLMVKRLASAGAGRIALLSQNLAYPPVEVSLDEVEVLGRVVWKSGRL